MWRLPERLRRHTIRRSTAVLIHVFLAVLAVYLVVRPVQTYTPNAGGTATTQAPASPAPRATPSRRPSPTSAPTATASATATPSRSPSPTATPPPTTSPPSPTGSLTPLPTAHVTLAPAPSAS